MNITMLSRNNGYVKNYKDILDNNMDRDLYNMIFHQNI
jgi:hypothetical protein